MAKASDHRPAYVVLLIAPKRVAAHISGAFERYGPGDWTGRCMCAPTECARTVERALADTVYIVTPVQGESGKVTEALATEKVDIRTFDSAEQLIDRLGSGACGCIIAPVDLPGMGVRSLIKEIRRRQLCLTVVVLGREDDLRAAVDIVRAGTAEFVEHPFSPRRLRTAVHRAIASARVAHAHCH